MKTTMDPEEEGSKYITTKIQVITVTQSWISKHKFSTPRCQSPCGVKNVNFRFEYLRKIEADFKNTASCQS